MRTLLLVYCLLLGTAEAREVLIVGNNYGAPKIYAQNDQPSGLLVDILSYADASLPQHQLTLHLYPWARAYWMAREHQAGIVGLSWTAERQQIFDYSIPLFYDEVLVVVRRDRAFDFAGLDDLAGRRVGLGAGGSFGEDFEQARRRGAFEVIEDNGPVPRLKKLLAGRIDAALINPGLASLQWAIGQDLVLRKRAGELLALPQPLKRDANYLGFHKSMAMGEFLEAFNAVIQQGYDSGEIPRLLERSSRPVAQESAAPAGESVPL
ncbi:transporter substrate-binding domain-containing protein [Pseudomonas sp. LPB0260]|uniref:substrate-binding periplasmic protein n=1 Tax=Pseudomonas sp. LPB0260 TaxID=2614442 RepID=UPI0015C1DB9A|nr:transporter substrate-binding domain-containing protein [Pseudomonas sp. LPB0260]QLC72313.1 transporter substrate-binding domain-containing protein [Pseudomonas sp. LPB0260]QLC75090.1 transporter substrate-binding domain-containing protein [Pseudomonas sp. LPB0260]